MHVRRAKRAVWLAGFTPRSPDLGSPFLHHLLSKVAPTFALIREELFIGLAFAHSDLPIPC